MDTAEQRRQDALSDKENGTENVKIVKRLMRERETFKAQTKGCSSSTTG